MIPTTVGFRANASCMRLTTVSGGLEQITSISTKSIAAWQFTKMLYTAEAKGWTRFVTMQNHYNLIYREEEREMIPLCLEEGIGLLPWSPLARGRLAGKRRPETM